MLLPCHLTNVNTIFILILALVWSPPTPETNMRAVRCSTAQLRFSIVGCCWWNYMFSLYHWRLSSSQPISLLKRTLWSPELYGLGHRTHSFWVSGLDLEVVCCVQCQLLNLMGQTVAYHWFNNPVMHLCIYISTVVDDITCKRWLKRERERWFKTWWLWYCAKLNNLLLLYSFSQTLQLELTL